MAEKRKVNPWLKLALDIGPVIAFFAGYVAVREKSFVIDGTEYSGFILVTAAFVPLFAASIFALWRLTGHVSKMQLVTLVLVVVFGGLTVWLNDERFFKMKPTLIYALFAAVLGFGLMRGESYLQLVMDEVLPMTRQGWMILTRRVMGFFAALAVANEIVWRSMSTDAWVNFKTFGLTIATFAFFMAQSRLFQAHAATPPDEAGEDGA